jgi:hypothetical protein
MATAGDGMLEACAASTPSDPSGVSRSCCVRAEIVLPIRLRCQPRVSLPLPLPLSLPQRPLHQRRTRPRAPQQKPSPTHTPQLRNRPTRHPTSPGRQVLPVRRPASKPSASIASTSSRPRFPRNRSRRSPPRHLRRHPNLLRRHQLPRPPLAASRSRTRRACTSTSRQDFSAGSMPTRACSLG